ncbi:hypothetical protein PCG10_005099 [Penicillium crustosum]|uniref:Uncharacterized protein n=1 Tax=Penicillium crustosum TaxID=36656 RepID=A0A9P5L8R2_PENCR|nr:hypothetical protein PCG10_005099 [Penicillium crustosum]
MKNKEGWDGKMRMEPKAVITNPEALEDSDYSDPDAPPVEEIEADEDLLADEDVNAEVGSPGLFADRRARDVIANPSSAVGYRPRALPDIVDFCS